MPRQYEAIRDKLVAGGTPLKAAKTKAAKIYNARRKPGQAPVTGPDPVEAAVNRLARK